MGYTLSDFRAKADEAHKGLKINNEVDGVETDEVLCTLRSTLRLSDAEMAKLTAAQDKLTEYQKDKNRESRPSEIKKLLVDVMAVLSDKPTAFRQWTAGLDLAVVTQVFKVYQEETQAPEGN